MEQGLPDRRRPQALTCLRYGFVRDARWVSVVLMPQVWTPDDLRFADVRAAHFEDAEQVAGDLLAAAGQPGSRLEGVTAAEASLRAAELLIAQDRDRAASIAGQVLRDVRGSSEELAAACMLARTGHRDAVEALAAPALSALQDRPGQLVVFDAARLALYLADGGQLELAARVADEAAAEFEYFCGYLRLTGADPRLATTMTGFTARLIGLAEIGARGIRQLVRWPPAERSRCWCGSTGRYGRCCRHHR